MENSIILLYSNGFSHTDDTISKGMSIIYLKGSQFVISK